MNGSRKLRVAVSLVGALVTVGLADEGGYFLSMKQKRQLVASGRIQDEGGQWYDVRICPGYKAPARYAGRNFGRAGDDLHEYVEKGKYREIRTQCGDAFEFALSDCLADFAFKGTGRAWRKYWGRANRRVEKRVFGWWMAYPWATMQGVVDNVVRIPVGLVGSVAGVVVGGVGVPVYHLTDSAARSLVHGAGGGVLVPTAGMAWNTLASPPLALLGQRPAESRVDGFWVVMVGAAPAPSPPLAADDLDAIAEWAAVLLRESEPYEKQRAAVREDTRVRMRDLRKDEEARQGQIKESMRKHLRELAGARAVSQADGRSASPVWTATDLQRHHHDILRRLEQRGELSRTEQQRAFALLTTYPEVLNNAPPAPPAPEKTDPLRESVRVIKEID